MNRDIAKIKSQSEVLKITLRFYFGDISIHSYDIQEYNVATPY